MKERKTFTFDGENSADYGLYISGDSVYNAPNREIDMISIPGRNGQLAIDMGRYENITVTYPAFVIADTQAEFREKIRRIRNWLCSKTSYQRLTDDYNPESFRLGLYKSGLEVEPIFYNRCGEFEMSFDCQPQRFLFEGEEVFTLGEWGETETYSGSIASFEGTETTAVKSLKANITPIQSGSGDPSPSNVRPISGYDSVNVYRTGINITDEEWEVGSISTTGYPFADSERMRTKNFNPCSPSTQYYVLFPMTGNDAQLFYYDINKNFISGTAWIYKGVVTTPSNAHYIKMLLGRTYGTTYNNDISINYPSTDTEYHAYQGTSYPISLGQTVYGGTLEVCSGKLTINAVKVDMGAFNWAYSSTYNMFYITLYPQPLASVVPSSTWYAVCECYKYEDNILTTNRTMDKVCEVGRGGYYINDFLVRDTSFGTSTSDFKASVNGKYLVYKVINPTEITLTPTQVTTLLGDNNIWADSGTVEVEIGENPYILVNPTKFEACPIFEVEGAGTLSIGDTTLTISNTGTTIIDTEMMEAYEDDNGAIISRNDDVEGGFPTLTSGINNVEADGLTSVKVTPKFWEL